MGKMKLVINDSLKDDLFLIPIENNRFLVYSPLRRKYFCVNNLAAKYVQDFLQGEEIDLSGERFELLSTHLSELNEMVPAVPMDNRESYGKTLTIILSQICNMECAYCYAQKGHSNDIISEEKLKSCIDYFNGRIPIGLERVVFIGGGEPMMTWPLLRNCILFIKNNYNNIPCSVITNGSILSDEQCDFFIKNKIRVIVSFDILPDIQNAQRPLRRGSSYDIVCNNIEKLMSKGDLCKGFRSTITEINVNRMEEMVWEVVRRYPSIKNLNFEPVSMHNIPVSYYKNFIKHFLASQAIGNMYGINVYCSISLSLGSLKKRFCQREICLTPNGQLVSCHRNSSPLDEYYNYFKIGYVKGNEVSVVDYESMSEQKKWQLDCEKCFAKWHCAGGCVSTRLMLTPNENAERCFFVKSLIAKILYNNIKQ